jgi:ABC-type nitrate/sulfonate/bicarbonate transport system permease component
LVLLAIWSAASWLLGSGLLPGPIRAFQLLASSAQADPVISAQGGGSYGYSPHVLSTFWHVFVGAVGGMAVGGATSIAAAQWSFTLTAADTVLEVLRTIPPLIFVPFAAIVFSGSDFVQLASVALYAALMISVYVFNAIDKVPPNLMHLSALLGASRWRRILTVQVPGMLPSLLAPVRLVLAFSLGISVVAEYLASPTGIGRVMKYAMAYSNSDLIIVGVLWTVLLAFVFDALTVLFFSALIRWTGRRQLLEWMAR